MKKTSTGETSIFRPLLLQMLTTFCIFFFLLWPAPVSGADRNEEQQGHPQELIRRDFNDLFLELVEVTEAMERKVNEMIAPFENPGLQGQPQLLNNFPRHFALILFTFFHERMVNAFGDQGDEDGEGLDGTNNFLLVLLQDLKLMPNPYRLRHAINLPFSVLKLDWAEYRRLYQPNLQFDTMGTFIPPELRPLFTDLRIDPQTGFIEYGQVKQMLLAFVDQYMLQEAHGRRFADRMRNAFQRYTISRKRLVRIKCAVFMILLNPFTQLIVDWQASGALQDRDNPAEPFPGLSIVTIGEELHFQPRQVVPPAAAVEVPRAPVQVAAPVLDSDDSLDMDAEMMGNFQLPQMDPQEVERLLAEGGGGGGLAQQQMHLPPHPTPPPPPEVAEPRPFVPWRCPMFHGSSYDFPAELPERLFSDSEGSNSSTSDYE